jgi:hypothetical protein
VNAPSRWARAAIALGGIAGVASCGPVQEVVPPGPENSCPEHPCDAYAPPGQAGQVACVAGVCVVQPAAAPDGGASPTSDLVLVVDTDVDGFFAPGQSFALSYDALRRPRGGAASGALPQTVNVGGFYPVTPSEAVVAGWDLGVPGPLNVSLPVHATFEPLALTGADGTTVQAASLPLGPVEATSVLGSFESPGPGGGQSTQYGVAILPPGTYVQTVTPDPPFDRAFGPSIKTVTLPAGMPYSDKGNFFGYDTTGAVSPVVPTYTISRDRGSFDGWTAYLHDELTGAVISNVAPLHDQSTTVTFTVLRIAPAMQPDKDALLDTTLRLVPPQGSIEPTYIGTPVGGVLPAPNYPTLPSPVTVQGTITGGDGQPASADLVFEAVGITTSNGLLDKTSFELTRWVSVDSGASGAFSVVLPPGHYRFDIRPRETTSALSVRDLEVPVQFEPMQLEIALVPPLHSAGRVEIADGRSLSDTVMRALPTKCLQPQDPITMKPLSLKPSPWCLPRPFQTATDAAGNFDLALDPGQYAVRAEPPASSRLPWVAAPVINVTDTAATQPGRVRIPAPLSIGMQLTDPSGNPIRNALVRVFRMPMQGTPVELGDALTDATGRYELYVAPPGN